MTTYTGALVRERDSKRVTDMLIQRHDIDLPPNQVPVIEGIIVKVITPPFEHHFDWPVQVLVYWQGGDFVPDLVEWTTPLWLEPAYPNATYRADLYGFPILAMETDGYNNIIVRNPNGLEAATVEIHPDSSKSHNELFKDALRAGIDAWCREPDRDILMDTSGSMTDPADTVTSLARKRQIVHDIVARLAEDIDQYDVSDNVLVYQFNASGINSPQARTELHDATEPVMIIDDGSEPA